MASEAEIRGAERARLEAVIGEFGTERERLEVLLDGVMRNGISQGQYLGEEPLGHLPAGIGFLARLARRVERRARFGLPGVECGGGILRRMAAAVWSVRSMSPTLAASGRS
jgi:hypothetical protein